MKVIFLDFDGVLNIRCKGAPTGYDFSARCVGHLNHIIKETGAVIVVSSSWRHGQTTKQLGRLLKGHGVNGKVVGKTATDMYEVGAVFVSKTRGQEIKEYLDENPSESMVILDDEDSDMRENFPEKIVKTDHIKGITEHDAFKAVEILQGRSS